MSAPTPRAVLCAGSPLTPRAAQLARGLRDAGYSVDISAQPDAVPAGVVVWTQPQARTAPLPPACGQIHVVDLHGGHPGDHLAFCQGAALGLVGSEVEAGRWAAALDAASITLPLAVVPYAAPLTPRPAPAGFGTLSIIQSAKPSLASQDLVRRASDWAAKRGDIRMVPTGPLDTPLVGSAPDADGILLLDVRDGRDAEDPVPPDRIVDALASGAPVLCAADTALFRRLLAMGAGVLAEPLEASLDLLAASPPEQTRALSAAAIGFAQRWLNPAEGGHALAGALARAQARAMHLTTAWRTPNPGAPALGGRVLVISDEAPHLADIRVHLPMGALHRRGLITGYAILRHGEIAFSTGGTAPQFDAIWVHRSVDEGALLLTQALGRPFVYDVDDNLLASPLYRAPFPAETMETARALLRNCAVLSCATPLLFSLLQQRAGMRLAAKAVVTPNLAQGVPRAWAPGPPNAVVWASSDQPALTGSRVEVERAVRDFCLAHGLRLVCMGAAPPAVLAESAVEIEHIGLVSHTEYLDRLRALSPAILVCPLETGAEAQTQDFVDGKSDVKMIEARLTGLAGVFSDAAPYRNSDLPGSILCENTHASWLAGLEQARLACLHPQPPLPWPERRDTTLLGPLPWAEALVQARLPCALTLAEVQDAVRFVQQQQAALLGSAEEFDEAYYFARHPDVREAVEQGVMESGFVHYQKAGFRERRAARKLTSAKIVADAWWAHLLHTVSRLETEVNSRAGDLDRLRGRVALRRALPRDRPAPPPPAPEPAAHPSMDLVWQPPGVATDEACPVCDAPGPHPALLCADGHILIRCTACASCFYRERIYYDYEREKDAALLLQLYLEQNASIYHQTRFMFEVDDPEIDSFLDVGCGFGYPVDVAAKVLGWRATGIDPSFYARDGAAILKADIRKDYLTAETDLGDPFGLVMASEVIEHVPDPYAFLALLRRWMKPGATLVLTTPDCRALSPTLGEGSLIGILALKVHLILFNQESLALALRRAGFQHVQVESAQDNLVAYASDRPLRFRADAAARHVQAYKAYLEHLVQTAEPGSALWNGGAGRLFTLLAGDAPLDHLHALFARIAEAWRVRYGIDLARLRLPELLPESAFHAEGGATPERLAASQPLNLAGVLFNRAVIENRTPGRLPDAVIEFARPAYRIAVQTRRILQTEDMIDLDLKLTAWRARQMILDCLAEIAPEVEGELVAAMGQPSPGTLHDRIDPPREAVVNRAAAVFIRAVQADRFDEARRLEGWMADLDEVCAATSHDPERLFRSLFTIGVLRLVGDGDAGAALEAFQRMQDEAGLRPDQPIAQQFLAVARDHVRLAASRLAGTQE